MKKLWPFVLAGVLVGCDEAPLGVDMRLFERLPDLEQLDFAQISPAQPYQYWELRRAFDFMEDRILGSGGSVPRSGLDPALIAAMDEVRPNSGLFSGCLPGHCFTFITAVNGSVRLFATRQGLREFLGPINSKEEAALVVHAHNMWWDAANPDTGYRTLPGAWEFVALQLVRDCTPVQTDRVFVRVRMDGSLIELDREIYQRDENMCA